MKVSYPTKPVGGGMGTYDEINQPYLDFFKDVVAAYPTGIQARCISSAITDNQAAIIRGTGVPTPPATNLGPFPHRQ